MENLSETNRGYYEDESQDSPDDYGDEEYCDFEDLEANETGPVEIIKLPIPDKIMQKYDFIKDLPNGICVMGGVARSIAREILTGEFEPVRDIDLIAIEDFSDDKLTDEVIQEYSMKYMPDDNSYGHGINTEYLNDYFNTRDITVNQSVVYKDEILITEQAINDFKENIIRPTRYEKPDEDSYLGSKLAVKILLMKVVLGDVSESEPTLVDFDINAYRINPFFVALGLNKAFNRGKKTAREFTNLLVEREILDVKFYDKPEDAAKSLKAETDFVFRSSGTETIAINGLNKVIFNRATSDLDYHSGITDNFKSNNKAVMSAVDDYADSDKFGDEYNDRYRFADYENINRA